MINKQSDCLIVVDVQNDFCSGGALEVPDGDAVVAVINELSTKFVTMDYGEQVLWPDHCVQGSDGARFHPELDTEGAELIIRKGFVPTIDSYSAFFENDRTTPTGLSGYLRTRKFERVFLAGLATDFCVAFSALDACSEGFPVFLVEDACRAIDLEGSLANAIQQMDDAGVIRIQSGQL
jgi:nicotinamidase/pyrazinamidase